MNKDQTALVTPGGERYTVRRCLLRLKELHMETTNCSFSFYFSTKHNKWRVALPNAKWGVIEDKDMITCLRKAIQYVEAERIPIEKTHHKFAL